VAKRPFVGSIERIAEKNSAFRRAVYTGRRLQLVVMSLRPGEEIGEETHPRTDQFFRIEKGTALFVFRGGETFRAGEGDAVVVPAGTRHNVMNPSRSRPVKLYTIYAPPQHPRGTIERTNAEDGPNSSRFQRKY